MKMKVFAVSLLAIPVLAFAPAARSATMESASAAGESLFGGLGAARFSLRLPRPAPSAQKSAASAAKPGEALSGAVDLQGFVTLEGRAFAEPGGGRVVVYLQGRASLADASQVYTVGPVEVDSVAHVTLGAGSPYAVAPVEAVVPVYKNGQKAGTVKIRGNVYVDGFATRNWVSLRGTGSVSGVFTPGKS
ncbi:MAG: hypothetical protein KGL04_08710 [Elusimicrobia bacterium]|nr:hypothetical protein [Elusimicrobiota bacterium]MDE2314241.1 hypothetical protein [Elusimicrobiota bacterium]